MAIVVPATRLETHVTVQTDDPCVPASIVLTQLLRVKAHSAPMLPARVVTSNVKAVFVVKAAISSAKVVIVARVAISNAKVVIVAKEVTNSVVPVIKATELEDPVASIQATTILMQNTA